MAKGWNVHDLYDCRNKLLTLLKKTTDKNKVDYITIMLNDLNDIINDILNGAPMPELSYNERLSIIEKELQEFGKYYDIIDDFVERVMVFDNRLNDLQDIFGEIIGPTDTFAKVTGAVLGNEQAFILTNNFFQGFDPILLPTFTEVFKAREKSIRYADVLRGVNEADSFYVDFINRYFIEMVKSDDPSKLFTIIHEYGHVLSYMLNPQRYVRCKQDMYDEVPAVFPEMLSVHENPGNFHPMHIAFEKYSSLVSVYNIALSLSLHYTYVDIWKENGRDANDGFMHTIKSELDEDEQLLDEGLDTYIDSCGTYVMAYLVCIELLNLYRRDKNKALEIYRNIMLVPYTEDTHDYVTSELNLGSHLEEETSTMLDDFEKKLKKVGVFHV